MKQKSKWLICCIIAVILLSVSIFTYLKDYTVYPEPGETISKTEIEYPDEGDEDNDGLLNKEEKEYGTAITFRDTDNDGIDDYSEIHVLKTEPLKEDTDNDSLSDGVELKMGLDPLNKKTDGKTADAKRKFSLEFEESKCKLKVEGNANITNIYVGTLDSCNISNLPGVVSELYEFYMEDMNFDRATVEITYDDSKFVSVGKKEENLKIYQLLDNGTYKKVGGTVDKENNVISVELEHFSKYFVADESILEQDISTNVFLLLDNSGSMYPKELCETSEENDVDFKRVDMAKALVELGIKDGISFGAAKFTKNYMELESGFDNSKEELLASLESIKTTEETFNGTYIAKSIKSALGNFEKNDNSSRKFIVLLTDGATTEGSGLFSWTTYDEDDAIYDAQQKNVSIIVVGLGNSVDTEYLRKIADNTGGAYIYANDSGALEKIHQIIKEQINYNMIDSDGDGTNDRILVADSGFDVSKDIVNLKNPYVELTFNRYANSSDRIQGGFCYGISAFQQLYYSNRLPLEVSAVERHNTQGPLNTPVMVESISADISEVEFFSNIGKYAKTKENLATFYPEAFQLYNAFRSAKTEERYAREGNRLVIKDNFREMFEKTSLIKITLNTVEEGAVWSGDRKEYTEYELPVLTLDVEPSALNQEDLDAYNVLLMIHNYWAEQGGERTENDRIYNLNTSSFESSARENAFYMLIDDLKNGMIPIMSGPAHAINATALYRDIENPSIYYLQCYDNNSPGTIQEIVIEQIYINSFRLDVSDALSDFDYKITDPNNIFGQGENAVVGINFVIIQ